MGAAKINLKSPFVPLFQRGNLLRGILNPSLKKRGRGDFAQK
jgi:hypothetical protein